MNKCEDCLYHDKHTDNPEYYNHDCAICKDRPNRSKDKSKFVAKKHFTESEVLQHAPSKHQY